MGAIYDVEQFLDDDEEADSVVCGFGYQLPDSSEFHDVETAETPVVFGSLLGSHFGFDYLKRRTQMVAAYCATAISVVFRSEYIFSVFYPRILSSNTQPNPRRISCIYYLRIIVFCAIIIVWFTKLWFSVFIEGGPSKTEQIKYLEDTLFLRKIQKTDTILSQWGASFCHTVSCQQLLTSLANTNKIKVVSVKPHWESNFTKMSAMWLFAPYLLILAPSWGN